MNFFSDLSLWWIPLFAIFAVGISYFYYFRTSQKTSWEKKETRILFGLRAAGLFLLLLMLLGLVWESISYRQEKPLFVTMIDQSGSMLNYKDSARVKGEIESFRQALAERYGDKFELRTLSIGEKVTPNDTLRFNQKKSNLAAGFDHLHDQFFNRNLGGVVLISDGNFNDGAHPMYSAERLQFTPVFTLGVGDTINKKDLALRSVLSNEVAFTNNVFPIEAIVDANKFAGSKVEVSLLHNGKAIQRKSVQISNSAFDQQRILFEVEAKEKGFQRYSVVVEHKKGEFTFDNNAQTCYIEIVDTKSDIVILADAPHPDLAAIRSVLSLDKRTTIQTDLTSSYTIKNKLPDLVIWYENGTKPNYGLFQQLKDKGVPVWFILGPTISITSLSQFGLNIKIPNTSQQDDVYPTISAGFNAFQFTDDCQEMLRLAPPLRAKFGSVGIPNDAEVLLTQRVGNITKKDPLFLILNSRKAKIGVTLGEGIWRWKMKEFMLKRSNAGFEEFVNKVASYLTIKQNTDPFRVTFPKRFNVSEDIEAKAEYYSEAMELITTPEISLTVTKTGGKPVKVSFTPVSNFYKAGLGQLTAGTYRWMATAKYKGKTISKSGTFVVDDIALEQLTNRADFNVLQQVSKQSDGSFHPLKDYNKLLNELEKRSDIATVQFEDSGFTSIIDWWWYFVIMILVFGTEWFLRRRWGSY
jgi:hypothetical protein